MITFRIDESRGGSLINHVDDHASVSLCWRGGMASSCANWGVAPGSMFDVLRTSRVSPQAGPPGFGTLRATRICGHTDTGNGKAAWHQRPRAGRHPVEVAMHKRGHGRPVCRFLQQNRTGGSPSYCHRIAAAVWVSRLERTHYGRSRYSDAMCPGSNTTNELFNSLAMHRQNGARSRDSHSGGRQDGR